MSFITIQEEVLFFWFGERGSPNYGEPKPFWFESTPKLDTQIRKRFEKTYDLALEGKINSLMTSPQGSLALILILDQFPRNMYRGHPQAFASDSMARNVLKNALINEFDKVLLPVERTFLYLPLEHSEDPADQKKSVELYMALRDRESLKYAIDHQNIIAKFGRFPTRNAILGRVNTPAEALFLEQLKTPFTEEQSKQQRLRLK